MKKIAIIVAMDKELVQLRQLFADNGNIRVEKCGIGKVNAALGAQRMIFDFQPDIIISSGCAGGNGVKVGDVVVSSELCYHDVYCGEAVDSNTVYGQVQGLPARYTADKLLLDTARTIGHEGFGIHTGLIVTGDWFVDSREKMEDIVGHFPDALAVDMESAAIAQTCYLASVPFVSFRIISDVPLSDDHASQYHNFWETVSDHSFSITRTFVEKLLKLED